MQEHCSLLWLDLEMTGLNADHDVILEIAVIATDINLTTMIEGPSLAIYQTEQTLQRMNSWVRGQHTKSGLLDRVAISKISESIAEKQVLDFIQEHCSQEFHFAGNSIYQDKTFLKKYMPRLNERGHYRVVDVSSLKVLIKGWYPNAPEADFKKSKAHRALDDIRESVAELRHYKQCFFK